MKHLMIDLETLGNKPGCVITSIAAVQFDMKSGETGAEFYQKIDLQSCLDLGLFVQASSIQWWFEQPKEAQLELFKDTNNITKTLFDFKQFIDSIKPSELKVWGNSARFDLGILAKAYYIAKHKEIPWKYTLERDVRTLASFNPDIKKNEVFVGVKHNPIDDCKHQIKYCSKIWVSLNIQDV
jgi:hypothetical protein